MTFHAAIYKRDSKGNLRVWLIELDGDKYRTHAGLHGGNLVVSEWTVAKPKNVGKKNALTAEQQALTEVEAAYVKKLTREYHKTKEATDGGAHFYKPMLAEKWEGKMPKTGGYVQPKLDGIRCIANKDGLWSREGKPILGVPHIWAALAPLFAESPDAILDGELYNHALRDDFNSVVSAVRKDATKRTPEQAALAASIQYHVYDFPWFAGLPFSDRLAFGKGHVEPLVVNTETVDFVPTWRVDNNLAYDELHAKCLEMGFEGSMFRLDGNYENKRSNFLLKRKEWQDDEFVISAVYEGEGNWSGCAKMFEIALPSGKKCRGTFKGTHDEAEKIWDTERVSLIGTLATVKFFNYTPDGALRFPVVTKLHRTITREV